MHRSRRRHITIPFAGPQPQLLVQCDAHADTEHLAQWNPRARPAVTPRPGPSGAPFGTFAG